MNELDGNPEVVPWQMNVSVFKTERPGPNDKINIAKAVTLIPGEIITGFALGVDLFLKIFGNSLLIKEPLFSGAGSVFGVWAIADRVKVRARARSVEFFILLF